MTVKEQAPPSSSDVQRLEERIAELEGKLENVTQSAHNDITHFKQQVMAGHSAYAKKTESHTKFIEGLSGAIDSHLKQDHRALQHIFNYIGDRFDYMRMDPFDILIVGEGFEHVTGGLVSIRNYYRQSLEEKNIKVHLLPTKEINKWDAWILSRKAKYLIVNSLGTLYQRSTFSLLDSFKETWIYLHETDWTIRAFEEVDNIKYERFRKIAPKHGFLCVSKKQEQYLKDRFGITKTHVIGECSAPFRIPPREELIKKQKANQPANILMIGSIQRRKGASFYSLTAEMAFKQQKSWIFSWIGPGPVDNVYMSQGVKWLGVQKDEQLNRSLREADVFFLSSIDDPFPLCVLEAIREGKRIVVYRDVGSTEIIEGLPGCAIYDEHTPEAALAAIDKVLSEEVDLDAYEEICQKYVDTKVFYHRINEVLGLE